jgi:hypothetical protein
VAETATETETGIVGGRARTQHQKNGPVVRKQRMDHRIDKLNLSSESELIAQRGERKWGRGQGFTISRPPNDNFALSWRL